MTATIVAQVVDQLGTAAWYWYGDFGGRHLEEIRSHPAASFDDCQPAEIPITLRHDGPRLGTIAYLEHGIDNTDLTAVAVLDCDPDAIEGLYPSAEITATMPLGSLIARSSRLDGLAAVGATAGVAARPIRAFRGDYRNRYDRSSWGWRTPKVLERAAAACPVEQRWARPTELRIHRPDDVEHRLAAGLKPLAYDRPTLDTPLEVRSAPTLDVIEHRRIIEVLAAPADQSAAVIIRGRLITESFAPGAFAGDEHRAHRVKANREHNVERIIGKAVRIDPHSQLGCIAELRISKTPLGDETLALAEDRVLDASAGFRVRAGGEQWNPTRTHRTVTAGELDHVALVASPAYESAGILDVRGTR